MAQGRERLERILEHDPEVTIYGVTTGPGQLAGKTLTPEQRERWAGMSPARIATSWGDPLPDRAVRAIVLARLANFVEGHAAVSPEIARRVAAMLNEDEMPVVPTKGQGGAGEILSLSHLFANLAEEAKPAIKDVMCLVNGSPAASGLVADAALVAERRVDVAARVFALSFEAFNAPLCHLDAALGDYWNNPHDQLGAGAPSRAGGGRSWRRTAPLPGARQLPHPPTHAGPGPARRVARRRGRGRIPPGRDGQSGLDRRCRREIIPSVVS